MAVAFVKYGKPDETLPPTPKVPSRSPSLARTGPGNTIKAVKVRASNLFMSFSHVRIRPRCSQSPSLLRRRLKAQVNFSSTELTRNHLNETDGLIFLGGFNQ